MEKSEDIMAIERVSVSEVMQLEFGIGPVRPTEQYSDETVAEAVKAAQAPVEDSAIVCIDEREAFGGPEPIRRKTAGGGALTGFMAVTMANLSMFGRYPDGLKEQDPNEVFEFTARYLKDAGLKLGCHIDNHATPEKTDCGANDLIPAIAEDVLDDAIVAEIKPVVSTIMSAGNEFSDELFGKAIANFRELSEAGFFAKWESTRVPDLIKKLDGVVEVLNGDKDALRDPENKRHNHWGEAIIYNLAAGKSNNRDAATIPTFQLDKDGVDKPIETLSTSQYEVNLLRHGAYVYNALIARRLTTNQRVIVSS